MNHRDRQILCGLFLSKFDMEGLQFLGFENFTEAFNALGYGLGARPASIKNYRDELDPYFPNDRKGWHKRPLRDHCKQMLELYRDTELHELGNTIKGFLLQACEAERIPEILDTLRNHYPDACSPFAKRLITGRAAEMYFAAQFQSMAEFAALRLMDVTQWGCGFDFRLADSADTEFCAVEVKGLRTKSGQIQMTALEYDVACALGTQYYLVLVRNFSDTPYHTIIQNPAQAGLDFRRTERQELRLSYSANIT